jgi:hypothetical protein
LHLVYRLALKFNYGWAAAFLQWVLLPNSTCGAKVYEEPNPALTSQTPLLTQQWARWKFWSAVFLVAHVVIAAGVIKVMALIHLEGILHFPTDEITGGISRFDPPGADL